MPAVLSSKVAIIGVIRDAQESATNIMYTINDMTGEDIIVRKWLDNEVGFVVMLPSFIEHVHRRHITEYYHVFPF